MDQEKVGKYIKKIRVDNNLSQKEFASLFDVSIQAVSKWENGKNLPDIATMKLISDKFNISINDIVNGEESCNKINNNIKHNRLFDILIIILACILILCIGIFIHNKNNDYDFKVITSNCKDFDISGTLVFNNKKSSININNIKYCGEKDDTIYKKIECSLYESNDMIDRKLVGAPIKENINLDNYLDNLEFTIDKFSSINKDYKNIYLQINATRSDDKVISYRVNLKLSESCSVKE